MARKDRSQQIKIDLPLEGWGTALLWASVLVMLACLLYVNVYYPSLPDKIPIHFDLNGNVNGYGPKSILWMLCVVLMLTISGVLWASFYPEKFNYPVQINEANRKPQYQNGQYLMLWTALCCSLILLAISVEIVQVALGHEAQYLTWSIIGILLLMVLGVGYYMRRAFQLR